MTTGLEKENGSSAHATLRDALPELAIDSHTRGVDVFPPHAAYHRVTAVPCLWTPARRTHRGPGLESRPSVDAKLIGSRSVLPHVDRLDRMLDRHAQPRTR